ncbi:MAG: hypothetical protein UF329_09340 [Bulleidia sp.]|nr:hypothetical protein [Bulleidia sp.]
MKKLNKFFVFVLSLFCILGMVTPVFAEGENQVQLVSYEIVDETTSEKVPEKNGIFSIETGKYYTISVSYKGEISGDLIENLVNQLKSASFECLGGGSDSGQDEINEYGATFKAVKLGGKSIEILPGHNVTISAVFSKEDSVEHACELLESWKNEKDGPLLTLDNRATKESVQERLYSDLGPYLVDVAINNFSLKKATQTEKGSISFDAVISRGEAQKTFTFSNELAPVPAPAIKKLAISPLGVQEDLQENDGYHLEAGKEYCVYLNYIGDVNFDLDSVFASTNAFDKTSPQAGSDGYDTVYNGTQTFTGIIPRVNGTYYLEIVPGTKTKFVVTGGKEPNTVTPVVSKGTPATSVSSDADKIVENTKASYSEEQQAALKEGGKADVKVSVSKTTPTAEDKKLVEAQLNSTNKIAMYLDLGVKVSIKDADGTVIGSDVALSETGTPVQFTVALDDSFINTNNTVDRTYQVVRIHEGKVDVLPATFDPETKTITFESDKFSTYALMYTDTPKTSKTPVTSDDGNVALYAGMGVIALAAVVAMIFFKKKNA